MVTAHGHITPRALAPEPIKTIPRPAHYRISLSGGIRFGCSAVIVDPRFIKVDPPGRRHAIKAAALRPKTNLFPAAARPGTTWMQPKVCERRR
jgi:hypothetical protein